MTVIVMMALQCCDNSNSYDVSMNLLKSFLIIYDSFLIREIVVSDVTVCSVMQKTAQT